MKREGIIKKALLKTFGLPLKRVTIGNVLSLLAIAVTLFLFITNQEIVKKFSFFINTLLQKLSINADVDFEWAQSKLIIELFFFIFLVIFVTNLVIEIKKANKFISNEPKNLKDIFTERIGFKFKSVDRSVFIHTLEGDHTVTEKHNIEVTKGSVSHIPYFVYFTEPIKFKGNPTLEIHHHPPGKKPEVEITWEPIDKPKKLTYAIKFKNSLTKDDHFSYTIAYSVQKGLFMRDLGSILDKIKQGTYELDEPVEFFGELSTLTIDELNLKAAFPKNYPLKSYWSMYHMVFYGFSKNHNKIEEERLQKYIKKNVEPDGTSWLHLHVSSPLIGHKYLLIWHPLSTAL